MMQTTLPLEQQRYKTALKRLLVARANFDNADPKYVDAAVYQLQAAEEQFTLVLRELRRC